jgi:hypothetical protein
MNFFDFASKHPIITIILAIIILRACLSAWEFMLNMYNDTERSNLKATIARATHYVPEGYRTQYDGLPKQVKVMSEGLYALTAANKVLLIQVEDLSTAHELLEELAEVMIIPSPDGTRRARYQYNGVSV